MGKYKAIALDMDGTLVNTDKRITPKTKEALLKAQEDGMTIILASGRPITGMYDEADELLMEKHHGLLVSFGGAKVVDYDSKEVLFNQPLTVEQMKLFLRHCRNFDITPIVDDEKYLYTENPDGVNVQYEADGNHFILKKVDNLETFVDFETNKILTSGPAEYMSEIYDEMRKPFDGILNVVSTSPVYIEATALGVDKANSLDIVLNKLGIDASELIAFGDGMNDASMLEYAGYAVAMGNAVQHVKDIADMVTLSNDEDGIAYALERIL